MSIQSRIVRGVGYGALSLSMLGLVGGVTNTQVSPGAGSVTITGYAPAVTQGVIPSLASYIGPLVGGGYLTEPVRIKPTGSTQRQKEDESLLILLL